MPRNASKMAKSKKKLSPSFQEVAITQKRLKVKCWFLAQINQKVDNNMGFFSVITPKTNKFRYKYEKWYCKEISKNNLNYNMIHNLRGQVIILDDHFTGSPLNFQDGHTGSFHYSDVGLYGVIWKFWARWDPTARPRIAINFDRSLIRGHIQTIFIWINRK